MLFTHKMLCLYLMLWQYKTIQRTLLLILNLFWTQNHLMECLLADVTLVCLLTRMRESMVFIVALLVEAFPAKLTNIRSVSLMDPHMRIKGWTSIEGLSTSTTFMRFVWRVNDFVSAKGRGLAKSFATNFANKWSSTWKKKRKGFSNTRLHTFIY